MLVTKEMVAYDLCMALDSRAEDFKAVLSSGENDFMKFIASELLYLYASNDDNYKGAVVQFAEDSTRLTEALSRLDGIDLKAVSRRVEGDVDLPVEVQSLYSAICDNRIKHSRACIDISSAEFLELKNERLKACSRALSEVDKIRFAEVDNFMQNANSGALLTDLITVYLLTESLVFEGHYDEAYNKRVYLIKSFLKDGHLADLVREVLDDNVRLSIYSKISTDLGKDFSGRMLTVHDLDEEIQYIANHLC